MPFAALKGIKVLTLLKHSRVGYSCIFPASIIFIHSRKYLKISKYHKKTFSVSKNLMLHLNCYWKIFEHQNISNPTVSITIISKMRDVCFERRENIPHWFVVNASLLLANIISLVSGWEVLCLETAVIAEKNKQNSRT